VEDKLTKKQVGLIFPKAYLTKNGMGLEFDENINHEELLEIGKKLKTTEGAVQFWIGDWINENWDDYEHGKYDEAERLGYERNAIRDYSYVANSVKSAVRTALLQFAHHKLVASFSPEEQQKWLKKAVKNSWSILQFREAIKREEHPDELSWLKLYDIWNFIGKDELGTEHPGNVPSGVILNTLYYYTNENDLIVDPMAGGGVVIDCCKYLNRKCLAYDIKPVRDDIKKNDIKKGYPKEAKNCDLIFIDPPYYKKKEIEYGEQSISSLERKEYLEIFKVIAEKSMAIIKSNGYLAFLMEPYIDYKDSKLSIWLYDYILRFIEKGWRIERIFDVPESTQRYQAHDVTRAKENKQILTLRRQLIIFRK